MLRIVALALVANVAPLAAAQSPSVRFIDDLPINYIYTNVLGTGFYAGENSMPLFLVRDARFYAYPWRCPPKQSVLPTNRLADASINAHYLFQNTGNRFHKRNFWRLRLSQAMATTIMFAFEIT